MKDCAKTKCPEFDEFYKSNRCYECREEELRLTEKALELCHRSLTHHTKFKSFTIGYWLAKAKEGK